MSNRPYVRPAFDDVIIAHNKTKINTLCTNGRFCNTNCLFRCENRHFTSPNNSADFLCVMSRPLDMAQTSFALYLLFLLTLCRHKCYNGNVQAYHNGDSANAQEIHIVSRSGDYRHARHNIRRKRQSRKDGSARVQADISAARICRARPE